MPKIVDWYMDGKIDIDPMITHTLKLEDINKGFDLMHSGESIRSVVVYFPQSGLKPPTLVGKTFKRAPKALMNH